MQAGVLENEPVYALHGLFQNTPAIPRLVKASDIIRLELRARDPNRFWEGTLP